MSLRTSLATKLVLAFWIVSMLGIVVVAVMAAAAAQRQLGNFARSQVADELAASLREYYERNGSWEEFPRSGLSGWGHRGARPIGEPAFVLYDQRGVIVRGSAPGMMFGRLSGPTTTIELVLAGEPIGTLQVASPGFGPGTVQSVLAGQLRLELLLAALAATAGSLIVGVVVARRLTVPIREISRASRSVARGNLEARVPVRSDDELGELASSFNLMQDDLSRLQEARRNMTADIAHELRTPLGVLLGNAEALRDGVLPATPERLDAIYSQAHRLSRLVEDLRTLSLGEAGELPMLPQKVELGRLVTDAVHRFEPQALASKIHLQIPDPIPPIELTADPDRIGQVLDILLSNALRHASTPGRVEISVQTEEETALIYVHDDGPGIPPEDLEHLFQRFHRSRDAQAEDTQGSGLGLVIAKSLVNAHGGSISVRSTSGSGTTFTVELPTKQPPD